VCSRMVVAGEKGGEMRSEVKRRGTDFVSIGIWCFVRW
jgi:hypothetical protein